MSIVVAGTIAFDSVKTPFGECERVLGGSAVYAALAASVFGPVKLVGVVGKDFTQEQFRVLGDKGIDTEGVTVGEGNTFFWRGEYGWDLSNPDTLATELNTLEGYQPRVPEAYRETPYVFLANIHPSVQMQVLEQMPRPRLVVCDTMNYWIENTPGELREVLKKVDVCLLNETEARMLTGEKNILKMARAVHAMGPPYAVIKKGEHGAVLSTREEVFCTPAFLLESIFDPTGAGDTFAGGFLGYLAARGKTDTASFKKAVVYGSVLATFAVEDFSVRRLAALGAADLEKRFAQFRQLTCF
ncbi:MAG: sugar kinase [Candidatus Omnitrophica bacterium]|nr:sugar kinase [Candidatus Omnitrophota bacterium]